MGYFNIDTSKFGDYVCIKCSTKEQSDVLLKALECNGWIWRDGRNPTFHDYYEPGETLYYFLNILSYGKKELTKSTFLSDYNKTVFKIITFKNLIVDEKTKDTNPLNNKNKGENCMNLFGTELEFGLCQDEKVTSTLLGVAAKKDGTWRVFDKETKTLTDVGSMKLGELPLYIMPSTKVAVGDMIKKDKNFYYVTKVNDDGTIDTMNAQTGNGVPMTPIKNILGMVIYTKVIAITDGLLDVDGADDKMLFALALSNGSTGNNGMNSLLPLMMFKKDIFGAEGDGDDSKFKKLMLLSCMGGAGGTDMNSLVPLMLLKGDLF